MDRDRKIFQKYSRHRQDHQPEVFQTADQNDPLRQIFFAAASRLSALPGWNFGVQVHHPASLNRNEP
jgi:hypothetical protein